METFSEVARGVKVSGVKSDNPYRPINISRANEPHVPDTFGVESLSMAVRSAFLERVKENRSPRWGWNIGVAVSTNPDTITVDPETTFYSLKKSWETRIGGTSDVGKMINDSYYDQIIGMGELALPFLFKELHSNPDFWFYALESIVRENPVPLEDRSDFDLCVKAWLKWGCDHKWITKDGVSQSRAYIMV
jgi:hypothetical protein